MKKLIFILAALLWAARPVQAQTLDSIVHHIVGIEGLFDKGAFEGCLHLRDGNVLFNRVVGYDTEKNNDEACSGMVGNDRQRGYVIGGNVFYKAKRHGGVMLDSIFLPDYDSPVFVLEKNPNGNDHISAGIVRDSTSGGSFLQILAFDSDLRFDSLNMVLVPLADTFAYLAGGFVDEQGDIVLAYTSPSGIDGESVFHIALFGLDGTLKHENATPFSAIPMIGYCEFGIFNDSPKEYYRLGALSSVTLVCQVFDSLFEYKDSFTITENALAPENPNLEYNIGWLEHIREDGEDFILCSRFDWPYRRNGVCVVRHDKQTLEQKNAVFFNSRPMHLNNVFKDGAVPIGLERSLDGCFYFSYQTNIFSNEAQVAVVKLDADLNVIWQRFCLEPGDYFPRLMKVLDDNGVAICGVHSDREVFFLFISDDDYDGMEEQGFIVRPYAYWPNPARDELHLEYSPDITPTQIELFDLQGRLVRSQRNGLESLDLQDLPSGTYTMRVTLEGGKVFSDKVVKE